MELMGPYAVMLDIGGCISKEPVRNGPYAIMLDIGGYISKEPVLKLQPSYAGLLWYMESIRMVKPMYPIHNVYNQIDRPEKLTNGGEFMLACKQ